jgi:hypothetical protein
VATFPLIVMRCARQVTIAPVAAVFEITLLPAGKPLRAQSRRASLNSIEYASFTSIAE